MCNCPDRVISVIMKIASAFGGGYDPVATLGGAASPTKQTGHSAGPPDIIYSSFDAKPKSEHGPPLQLCCVEVASYKRSAALYPIELCVGYFTLEKTCLAAKFSLHGK